MGRAFKSSGLPRRRGEHGEGPVLPRAGALGPPRVVFGFPTGYTRIVTASLPPLPPLPPPSARLPVQPARRSGGWLSLIIHLILALIVVVATRNDSWWDPPMTEGASLDPMGGGGSGRQVNMIALPEARRVQEPVPKVPPPPPPVPVPVVTPVQIPPPVPQPPVDTLPKTTGGSVTTGDAGGAGGSTGTGVGPGSGSGTGPGTGGPSTAPPDSARTAARDPEARQLILIPFDYPPSLRGHTVQVTFFVLADGRVDRVLFSEDISDRGYAKRLETVMRAYRFRPARSATGQPVAGHTTVSVTF